MRPIATAGAGTPRRSTSATASRTPRPLSREILCSLSGRTSARRTSAQPSDCRPLHDSEPASPPSQGPTWTGPGRVLDKAHISAYKGGVRRKPGTLLPLETALCVTAAALLRRGTREFHGYEIAKRLGDAADRRLLTAYGTLYRALGRLEQMGLLRSRWEDPEIPARENRPGRRLYTPTAAGEAAARDARELVAKRTPRRARRRLAPA